MGILKYPVHLSQGTSREERPGKNPDETLRKSKSRLSQKMTRLSSSRPLLYVLQSFRTHWTSLHWFPDGLFSWSKNLLRSIIDASKFTMKKQFDNNVIDLHRCTSWQWSSEEMFLRLDIPPNSLDSLILLGLWYSAVDRSFFNFITHPYPWLTDPAWPHIYVLVCLFSSISLWRWLLSWRISWRHF